MSKPLGSETFGTKVIRADEYILFAKVAKENGTSLEQAVLDIAAIDDMLSLQRAASLLNNYGRRTKLGRIRKNSSFLDTLDGRMNQLIEESKTITNTK